MRFTVRGSVRGNGADLAARNCVFVTVDDDGQVVRMDEYVYSMFLTQLGV